MTAFTGFQADLRLGPDGRLEMDIACVSCGYNLRGLAPDSRCPECGTAIGHSTRGDYLRFCDPGWVETLASGMNWIVAGIILAIVLLVRYRRAFRQAAQDARATWAVEPAGQQAMG